MGIQTRTIRPILVLYPIYLTRTTRPGGSCGYSDCLMWRTWKYTSDLIAVMRVDMALDAEVNVRINVKTDTVTRSMASVYTDVLILML